MLDPMDRMDLPRVPALLVRMARAEDAGGLGSLFQDLGYPASQPQLLQRLTRLIEDNTYAAWVGLIDDSPIGFAAGHLIFPVEDDAPAAQLIALVTAHDARGSGVGSALCREFEYWAISRGATRAVVNSGMHRADAHNFYESQGYIRSGVRFGKRLTKPEA